MTNELALPADYAMAIQLRTAQAGAFGSNLGDANHRHIRAENDLDAITAWLATFADRPTTYANYRKEAERLLLWALADAFSGAGSIGQNDLRTFRAFLAAPEPGNGVWDAIDQLKPIASLTHEDLLRYRAFLADPQPASVWVADPQPGTDVHAGAENSSKKGGARYSTDDPRWRPFAGQLNQSSVSQAIVIIGCMFEWLVDSGYLRGNPLRLLRRRRQQAEDRVSRYLPGLVWQNVKEYVAAMPEEKVAQQRDKERARWLITLLYLLGLRISEVAGGTMGSFTHEFAADGTSRWWLKVVGKGLKPRRIPVSDELVLELMRYRQAHGLTQLPAHNELTPLLLPYRRRAGHVSGEGVDRKTVHNAIKAVFAGAADWTELKGGTYIEHAKEIRKASAHWIRHTAATSMLDSDLDLHTVRDNLGHRNIATTNQYVHTEDDRRHDETTRKHRMKWE